MSAVIGINTISLLLNVRFKENIITDDKNKENIK